MTKTIVIAVIAGGFLYGLFTVFTPVKAHAQFQTCVWPNRCLK